MGFNTPTYDEVKETHWEDFRSRLDPVGSIPRYNILKINSLVNAGMIHTMNENLKFLALQLFPDTAESEFLDAHWSWRTEPRKLETFAVGPATVFGEAGTLISPGDSWDLGEVIYSAQEAAVVQENGSVDIQVRALTAGDIGDVSEGVKLSISTRIPGLTDTAESKGISGGTDREDDVDYKNRALSSLRVGTRYGKPGDWAAWALDSSAEVGKAWEYPLSDSYGTLLIQVLSSDKEQVADLDTVKTYIKSVAPPVLWNVSTPEIKSFDFNLHMFNVSEDTAENRAAAVNAIETWMNENAKPGIDLPSGLLSSIASSPSGITFVEVTYPGDQPTFTIHEYPLIGVPTWI